MRTGSEEWGDLYIDGRWRQSNDGETLPVQNPATREEFVSVAAATEKDVDEAYRAAERAQVEWSEWSYTERASVVERAMSVIERRRKEITDLLSAENGKVWLISSIELEGSLDMMDMSTGFSVESESDPSKYEGKENVVFHEPAGVIGVITPWNFPLFLSMRAVAPALTLGNTVVLKPDPKTPVTGGLLLADIFQEAGLPDGALNVVTGHDYEIGDAVSGHKIPRVLSFTGSTDVGRHVASLAAENFTKPSLELGGNNPHIVLEDADVELAASAGAFSSFAHQGQVCISINRHLVHESYYKEYIEKLVEKAESLSIGDPAESKHEFGPLIDADHRDRIVEFIESACDDGAVVETGGDYDGLYVEPTVLSNVDNEMEVSCDEHFGPIAPVIPFATDAEAIEMANATDYGLSSSVHSRDLDRAQRVADQLEVGMVHVNDQPMNDGKTAPFGGVKKSGFGRFNGKWIQQTFTETKWMSIQHDPRDYMIF